MKSLILAIIPTVLCLTTSGARAESPAAPRPPHSVALETYAFSGTIGGQPTSVIAPALFTNIALSERVSLNAAWLFAYTPSGGGARATFQAGNPSVGVGTVLWDGGFKLRAGGSLVLPFTLLSDPDEQSATVLTRAAMLRGNSAFSLVAPGLLGLTTWMDAGWRQGPLRLVLDLRSPLSLQLSPKRPRRLDVALQVTGYAGLDVLPYLSLSSSLQAIYVPTMSSGVDPTFLALIPAIRLHGSPGFVETRLTLNLDAPLGFSFERDRVWSVALALGTNF